MNTTKHSFELLTHRATKPVPGTIELYRQQSPHPAYRSHQYLTGHPIAGVDPDKEGSIRTPESPFILVVDEYPGLADLAKAILETEGYRVRAFRDRVRAWQTFYFSRPRPGLLITDDLGWPLSGIELIRRCKRLEPDLKAMWVSHRHPASLTKADRDLVDGFQPRPYRGPMLTDVVRRMCGPPW